MFGKENLIENNLPRTKWILFIKAHEKMYVTDKTKSILFIKAHGKIISIDYLHSVSFSTTNPTGNLVTIKPL